MTTQLKQLGLVEESTYGTPVTVDRFLEFNGSTIGLEQGRVESKGLRKGRWVQRADRFMPYTMGASGDITLDVPTKGFGLLLKHMLGTAAIGTVVDANYLQTFTLGSLFGKSLTIQTGDPLEATAATVTPFTWHGCKVTSWELSCDVDGLLVATLSIDAEDGDNSTGLATASYTASTNVFSFDGCAVTIGGTSFEASSFSVTGENTLNTGRRFLTGSALKKEPTHAGERAIGWSMDAEFSSTTQYDRFKSLTAAGTHAAIVATFTGPLAHGGTTLPQLVVTIPAGRFDADDKPNDGPEGIKQSLSGIALDNGAAEPLTITYRTTDSAA